MKKYILLLLLPLFACEKEEAPEKQEDPIFGVWIYDSYIIYPGVNIPGYSNQVSDILSIGCYSDSTQLRLTPNGGVSNYDRDDINYRAYHRYEKNNCWYIYDTTHSLGWGVNKDMLYTTASIAINSYKKSNTLYEYKILAINDEYLTLRSSHASGFGERVNLVFRKISDY